MWAWSVGVRGRPRCWWMAISAMNSRVVVEVICGPRSDQATRMGRRGSSGGQLPPPGGGIAQPLSLQRSGEEQLHLGVGELWSEQVFDPVPGDHIDDGHTVPTGPFEPGSVPHPDLVRLPLDRLRPGAGRRRLWSPGRFGQRDLVFRRHPQHGGGRHPHLPHIRAAVGQLAMGPVDGAPLFDQLQDRLLLPPKQPMDRVAARRPVHQRAHLPQPASPAMHPHIGDPQHRGGSQVRPPLEGGVVDQLQQALPGLGIHPGRYRQRRVQPQRASPTATGDNSIASSFTASTSQVFSARSSATTPGSTGRERPGFDAANAANAAASPEAAPSSIPPQIRPPQTLPKLGFLAGRSLPRTQTHRRRSSDKDPTGPTPRTGSPDATLRDGPQATPTGPPRCGLGPRRGAEPRRRRRRRRSRWPTVRCATGLP